MWRLPDGCGVGSHLAKGKALVDYGIDALHFTSCLVQLCPFKEAFLETIKRDYPDLTVVEGTHPFHDSNAFKKGTKELLSQRMVTPQSMNDLVFKKIKLPPEEAEQ